MSKATSTIPALLASAAGRFGGALALEDGATRLTYAELLAAARSFGAALAASGVEAGDRVAIWAGNSAEWIVALLGLFEAGAVLVPLNTRFKGGEAADILARSRARALVTVTDFLGTDYLALLPRRRRRAPAPRDDRRRERAGAHGDRAVGCLPRPGRRRRAGRGRAAATRGRAGRPLGHPLHVRHDGFAQGRRHVAPPHPARGHRLGGDDGARAGDRYLMVNPYFHMFGLKAGILASRRRRRGDAPRGGLRRRPGAGPRRAREGDGAARLAHRVPGHPRPPRAGAPGPVQPAGGGHRRRRHPRRARSAASTRSCRSRRSSPGTG